MTLYFFFSFPSLWSSFFSCLKPPYIFLVVNILIITIIAFSKCYPSYTLNCGHNDKIQNKTPLRRLEVKDVDLNFKVKTPSPVAEVERSNVVHEEKSEEILGPINSGYERVVLKDLRRNLSPSETPLVSARSGHRKLVKLTPKGKDKTALKPLITRHYKGPDTVVLGPGNNVKLALRKSETSRDDVVNNYHQSRLMKKRMSHEEQDLDFDTFIKKMKNRMRHEEQDLKFGAFIKKTKKQMKLEEQDLEFDAFLKKMKNRMRDAEQDLQFDAFTLQEKFLNLTSEIAKIWSNNAFFA